MATPEITDRDIDEFTSRWTWGFVAMVAATVLGIWRSFLFLFLSFLITCVWTFIQMRMRYKAQRPDKS